MRYPIGTGDGVNSSAVQLGKYVYYTAAHVVIDPTNQALTGLVVRPALHLPIGFESTPAIPVDAFFESGYTYDPSGVRGHDIAYLRAQKPHPIAAGYAVPIPIYTTRDTGVDSNGTCASAFESSDPYWSDASNSWFNPAGAFGANGCLKNGPERVVVHYPNSVGSVANTHDPYPYISTGTELTGNPNGHASYEMEHRTADTVPVIGMRNAFVSPGSSGGALFAKPYGGSAGDTLLLGIVNNAGPNNVGYAVGKFDTSSFWTSANINYQPPAGVSVSTPAEGGTYDSAHVPNLVASAGSQTSQLRWDSNIDGYLGSGGNVPISGRLSPGFQTITATLGSSFAGLVEQPKSTTTPLKIPHLTITGSTPAPSFIMTPSTVYIPTYRPVGSFSYEWHAPGYPSIDLQNSTNNGAWAPVPALNVPASGADTESITAGTTYKFRFMPHGSTTVLGTVQVTAVVAPTPVFAANPVHMVTNGASANTVVTWSALGYDVIDWCGNTNNQGWQCGSLSTAGSGSVGIPVPVGTTYGYRFYPHGSPNQGGTTQLLGELTVDCVGNTPPTFTANPAHIIVPAGGTDGSTIITWNAPTYSQLDWCGKVDSGPWTWGGLSTPPVGNTKVLVPLGSTYGYRFYGPGGATACSSTTKLGELSVYATH